LAFAAIAVCGWLASGFLGATTNAINGLVSETYFVKILHWHHVADVWRASIAQGIFEGLLFGVLCSLVFTVATGLITSVSCSFEFAFKHLLGVLAGAYLCWALGGVAALGLATVSPEFYSRTFTGVPSEFGAMLRYAWVGGSIWGAELGGVVPLAVGLVVLRANWQRHVQPKNAAPNAALQPAATAAVALGLTSIALVLSHLILDRLKIPMPDWLASFLAWASAVTGMLGRITTMGASVLAILATLQRRVPPRAKLLLWGIAAVSFLAFIYLAQVGL
jgi:hypothetical protein